MRLQNQRLGFSAALVSSAALATGLVLSIQAPSHAQAAYGSYVGVGPSVGLTEGDGVEEDREIAGVIALRYRVLEAPVSLRTQAIIGDGTAIVPTVSYDLPLNWQTTAYLGAGVAFVSGNTPVGNRDSFALQPGIDYVVPNSNTVIFGNAIIGFNGFREGGSAVSLQGGVGLRF